MLLSTCPPFHCPISHLPTPFWPSSHLTFPRVQRHHTLHNLADCTCWWKCLYLHWYAQHVNCIHYYHFGRLIFPLGTGLHLIHVSNNYVYPTWASLCCWQQPLSLMECDLVFTQKTMEATSTWLQSSRRFQHLLFVCLLHLKTYIQYNSVQQKVILQNIWRSHVRIEV